MNLTRLLEGLLDYKIYGNRDVNIASITEDSRQVKKRNLFVAVRGLTVDGHKFIPQAIENGASVIVGEIDKTKVKIPRRVTYVKVESSRKALGHLASKFYGDPSEKLKVIGVTGTDGKTTTAFLIYHILATAGKKVGLVSTVAAKIGSKEVDTGLHVTNPDPMTLQLFLVDMTKAGCEFAVVEVTSHGLDQERVSGVNFDSAVLTNITHEHLDYHKNFEEYRDTKTKLFQSAKNFIVLNKDDESSDYILKATTVRNIFYSLKDRSSDFCAQNIREEGGNTIFEVISGVNSFSVQTKLPGEYNVSNSLAAIAVGLEYGIEVDSIKKALQLFKAPKGRLEKIENNKGFEIYIDFAHTPNSLEQVLSLLKKRIDLREKKGKLITIFGCAGERDKVKRPIMGEISSTIADISIFTAEDPRSEELEKIIGQMVIGAKRSKAKGVKYTSEVAEWTPRIVENLKKGHVFFRIPERGEAISFALQKLARKGDTIVICGKGHEKSMAYNGVEYAWSDEEAVKLALKGDVKEITRSN